MEGRDRKTFGSEIGPDRYKDGVEVNTLVCVMHSIGTWKNQAIARSATHCSRALGIGCSLLGNPEIRGGRTLLASIKLTDRLCLPPIGMAIAAQLTSILPWHKMVSADESNGQSNLCKRTGSVEQRAA